MKFLLAGSRAINIYFTSFAMIIRLRFLLLSALIVTSFGGVYTSSWKSGRGNSAAPSNTLNKLSGTAREELYSKHIAAATKAINFTKNQSLREAGFRGSEVNDSTCAKLISKMMHDFIQREPYAIQIDDARGRRESGILKGNLYWLGNYYECNGASNGQDITGGMCISIFGGEPNPTTGLFVGLCVPDVCTGEEVTKLLETQLPDETFVSTICPRKSDFNALDITAIAILSFLIALVVSGTICECVLSKPEGNPKSGVSIRLLLTFSIINNTRTLLNTTRKEGTIPFFDGLRVFSIAWVLLFHTFAMPLADNVIDFYRYFVTHGSFAVVINGTLAVDTFFFMSGLLVAFLGFREMQRRGGKIDIPMMYLRRYLRLTPTMGLMILFSVSFFLRNGDGLLFDLLGARFVNPGCQKYWWTNFLYINNLYPAEMKDSCIPPLWYLAADMQFYLLSPVFLLLFYHNINVAMVITGFFIICSIVLSGVLSTVFDIPTEIIRYGKSAWKLLSPPPATNGFAFIPGTTAPDINESVYWDDIYEKPWCRIDVYLIGMIAGYVMHSTKRRITLNKIFVVVMWLAVGVIETANVYAMWGSVRDNDFPTQNVMSFYNAVSRPVWGLGLMWLTLSCHWGYGGPINAFLSWKLFLPFSRLTYCAYLIQGLIIHHVSFSREIELHWQIEIFIYYYIVHVALSFTAAYLLSMLTEAPVAGIQKILFSSRKTKDEGKRGGVVQEEKDSVAFNGIHVLTVSEKMGYDNHIELEHTNNDDDIDAI